jgi:hypothetical protein
MERVYVYLYVMERVYVYLYVMERVYVYLYVMERVYKCVFVGLLCKYKSLFKSRTGTHGVYYIYIER